MSSSRTAPASPQPVHASRTSVLLELLASVPDPRRARGIRHALPGILAVGLAAVLAGARSFAAIGQWVADADADLLAALGVRRGRGPSESAIRRAFARLDAARLEAILAAWVWTRTVVVDQRRVIAIDGKTVRGARTGERAAPHLVAAFDHGSGAVLGQLAVTAKSNEIPAVRILLAGFDLTGVTVTVDALCRCRHKASYGDLRVMPRCRRPGVAGGGLPGCQVGIIRGFPGISGRGRRVGSGPVRCPAAWSARVPVP